MMHKFFWSQVKFFSEYPDTGLFLLRRRFQPLLAKHRRVELSSIGRLFTSRIWLPRWKRNSLVPKRANRQAVRERSSRHRCYGKGFPSGSLIYGAPKFVRFPPNRPLCLKLSRTKLSLLLRMFACFRRSRTKTSSSRPRIDTNLSFSPMSAMSCARRLIRSSALPGSSCGAQRASSKTCRRKICRRF